MLADQWSRGFNMGDEAFGGKKLDVDARWHPIWCTKRGLASETRLSCLILIAIAQAQMAILERGICDHL